MAANVKIVELGQKSGQTIDQSEYTVSIPPGTKLNTGDMLSLEKAFLDTTATADESIVIPDALELVFEVGYYTQSVRTDGMDMANGGAHGYVDDDTQGYVDGKAYVLMKEHSAGAGFVLPGIEIKYNDQSSWASPSAAAEAKYQMGAMQAFRLGIEYWNPAGDQVNQAVDTNALEWTTNDGGQTWQSNEVTGIEFDKTKAVNFTSITLAECEGSCPGNNQHFQFFPNSGGGAGGGSAIAQFHDQSGQQFKCDLHFNPPPEIAPDPGVSSCNIFTTSTDTLGTNVIVPPGSYSESDMAELITEGVQQNYGGGGLGATAEILKSAFLLEYNPATHTEQADTCWIATDKSAAYDTVNPLPGAYNGGILVGATQMQLSWDEARRQFYWEYIHSPYMAAIPGTESVGVIARQNVLAGDGDPIIITRNGGIFFMNLIASRIRDGAIVPFWNDVLGFDFGSSDTPGLIVRQEKPVDIDIGTMPGGRSFENLSMPVELATGVNTTGGFPAVAMVSDVTVAGFWHMPDVSVPYFSGSAGETIGIFAGREDQANQTDETAFYLIEVSCKARGEFVGGDGYSNAGVVGVVGGYYSKGSFTTGSEADAIPFVNTGPAMNLESFRVRILGPNKLPAPNLGDDNSILLRITPGTAQ